jgi:hypothetical protein
MRCSNSHCHCLNAIQKLIAAAHILYLTLGELKLILVPYIYEPCRNQHY